MNTYLCVLDVLPLRRIAVVPLQADNVLAAERAATDMGRQRWGASIEISEVIRTDVGSGAEDNKAKAIRSAD